ncbi:aminotransferase, classes I and II superfamily [Synechococcus sp. PCC 7335]|uniref:LL-diaminopimelate aminotransferase n=1 Tax=Synechococcus sp. (strain ATCC 29403 / PCC 7335) TaxID=91464 RepID=UPI00017EC37B|nr:LL-diaminopimelate aminotransferase [Synechococcus sp. PCC 7335]EDX86987.1 aminotransferase, classes I and II superfamily [Synechococcus sp. PCC 7335]
MQIADRLAPLQTNVFADMDSAKARVIASGKQIIDLSLGSSDLPTPPHILSAIATALDDPKTHGYALFNSTRDFRIAAAQWYEQKYGISVNQETEVLPLIGSQEGTAHLPLAVLNPGDVALLLDPGYPSHAGGVYLAGGTIYPMPILAKNDFLPLFSDIPSDVLAKSRMMVLSYPHNPTTAIAPLLFFEEAVAFCQQHNIVLVHDFPYGDLCFEGGSAPSVLQADPDKSVSIEFFTLSKSYNMGGFRVGYAIGNAQLIKALRQVKATVDFNQYRGILRGAITALTGPQDCVSQMVNTFANRRDTAVEALRSIGWSVPMPNATMYIWAKLPEGLPNNWSTQSIDFCASLVAATGVALSPGRGFGKSGEGYVRFALVQSPDVLADAIGKIGEFVAQASV